MRNGEHKIFIISGPSRVGKEAIIKALIRKRSLNLRKVVTATTRARRQGEVHGKHFYFFTSEEFERNIADGYFLEWARYGHNRYGTPMHELHRIQREGKNVLLNIEVRGAAEVARQLKGVVRIFIKPDSLAILRRRMVSAGFTKEQITDRIKRAQFELTEAKKYDYAVVNREGKLKETVDEVVRIVQSELSGSKV